MLILCVHISLVLFVLFLCIFTQNLISQRYWVIAWETIYRYFINVGENYIQILYLYKIELLISCSQSIAQGLGNRQVRKRKRPLSGTASVMAIAKNLPVFSNSYNYPARWVLSFPFNHYYHCEFKRLITYFFLVFFFKLHLHTTKNHLEFDQ